MSLGASASALARQQQQPAADQSEATSEAELTPAGAPEWAQHLTSMIEKLVSGQQSTDTMVRDLGDAVGEWGDELKVIRGEMTGYAKRVEHVERELEDTNKWRAKMQEDQDLNTMMRGGMKQRTDIVEGKAEELHKRLQTTEAKLAMVLEQCSKLQAALAYQTQETKSFKEAVVTGGIAPLATAESMGGSMHVTSEQKQTFTITGVPGEETGKLLAAKVAQVITDKLKDKEGNPVVVDIVDAMRIRMGPKPGKPAVDKVLFKVHSAFDAMAIRKARSDLHKQPGNIIYINDDLTRAELQRKQTLTTAFQDRITAAKTKQAELKRGMVRWNRAQLMFRGEGEDKWVEVQLRDAPKGASPRKAPPSGDVDMIGSA